MPPMGATVSVPDTRIGRNRRERGAEVDGDQLQVYRPRLALPETLPELDIEIPARLIPRPNDGLRHAGPNVT